MACSHKDARLFVCDQTAGFTCDECGLFHACWAEDHIPANLWNLGAKNVPEWKVAPTDNPSKCGLCGVAIPDPREKYRTNDVDSDHLLALWVEHRREASYWKGHTQGVGFAVTKVHAFLKELLRG